MKSYLHHVTKLYAWFHDPRSSGPPDIFSQGCFTTQNASQKREIIQSNIHRILPKVNQVIYSLDTIYEPNSMILAQAVRQIFCSQGPLRVKCLSLKRGIILSNYFMILSQVVLQIFCSQGCFTTQNASQKKGDNSVKYLQSFAKS